MIMDDQGVNSDQIIDEGKTVDDAIEKGLQRLGLARDQVDVEVLKEGSKGVLSLIGAKQAKVIVRQKDDTAEVVQKLESMVTDVMRLMDLSSQITVEVEDDVHRVKIDTAGVDGLLIGKKGQNLIALEHLLRRMVGKQLKRSVRMEVDVGGYKERRTAALKSKATSIAYRVKASNKEMQIEPLSAAERRVVHLAVAGDPQIRTYTIGEGDLKSVVIAPQRRPGRNSGLEENRI
jgi:spoIIIJ-associated protein